MNWWKRIVFLTTIFILSQGMLNAKSMNINVEDIFTSIIQVKEIKVLFYVGDSLLIGIDLSKNDTVRLDASRKKNLEEVIADIKTHRPDYSFWSGTYPNIGETIIVVDYKHHYGNMTIFARKENENYRFWDPYYSFFVNTVFRMRPTDIYKPTFACADAVVINDWITCSDGFVVAENELRKIIDKFK